MIFRAGEFFQLEDLQSNVSVSHFEPEHGGAPTSGNLRNFRVLNPPTGAMFFLFFLRGFKFQSRQSLITPDRLFNLVEIPGT